MATETLPLPILHFVCRVVGHYAADMLSTYYLHIWAFVINMLDTKFAASICFIRGFQFINIFIAAIICKHSSTLIPFMLSLNNLAQKNKVGVL